MKFQVQVIVQTQCLCVYDLTMCGSEHCDLFLYFYDMCEWPFGFICNFKCFHLQYLLLLSVSI